MKCMADGILALPNNLNVLHVAQLEAFDEALIVVDEVLHADKALARSEVPAFLASRNRL